MNNEKIAELLLEIFGGNPYHAKSSVHESDIYYSPVEIPLTTNLLVDHIEGKEVLGAYQLIQGSNVVNWLGWDIDSKNLDSARECVKRIIKHISHIPYAVEFSGGKGYHVLIFLQKPMIASKAKKVVDFIREKEGFASTGDLHVECFPKQDSLTRSRPKGNLLKIPLGKHPRSHNYSFFIDYQNGWENGIVFDPISILSSKADPDEVLSISEAPKDIGIQLAQLLAQYWEPGKRHDLSLYLSGFLAQEMWSKDQVSELMKEITELSGDDELYNRLQTVETTFDKFKEGKKIRGRQGLGEIIPASIMQKVTELAASIKSPDTVVEIDAIRFSKHKTPIENARLAASTMWSILNDNGCKIFRTAENLAYWYDANSHEVIEEGSEMWRSILNHKFGMNPADKFSVLTYHELRLRIVRESPIIPVQHRSYWNDNLKILFVNLGGPEVFIIDGKEIKKEYNGECGHMFITNPNKIFITPNFDGEIQDAWEHLVNDLSFTTSADAPASSEEQRELLKAWILCFFFQELLPTKPILAMLGAPGSGKTTAMRRILRILEEPEADVLSISVDKPDAFRASVGKHRLLVLDNLEKSGAYWMVDMLNKLSTGSNIELRELYKTNVTYQIVPKCFIACTAVNIPFSDETLFSRLLALEMQQVIDLKAEYLLQKKIRDFGPSIWADLLRKLNNVVSILREVPTIRTPTKSRLVDFNVFCARIEKCQEINGSALSMGLLAMIDSQLKQLKESSQAITLLEEWISIKPQESTEWRSFQELYSVLSQMALSKHIKFQWKNSTSLGRHIITLKDRLIQDFGAEFGVKDKFGKEEYFIKFRNSM